MSAQVAGSRQATAGRPGPMLTTLARSILATAAVMLLLVALLLAARRVIGVPHGPPFPTLLLIAALVLLAIISAIRIGWWYLNLVPWRAGVAGYGWWLVSLMTLVLFAVYMSVSGIGAGHSTVLWTSVILFESGWWYALLRRSGVHLGLPAWGRFPRFGLRSAVAADSLGRERMERPATRAEEAASVGVEESGEDECDSDEALLEPGVYQQVTRSKSDDGMDSVRGLLKGEFLPGQRSQSLHVAFCPPMAARPFVEVVQVTGPRSSVKAADIQPYGVRFDVRLAVANQQSENVLIHFEAQNKRGDEA